MSYLIIGGTGTVGRQVVDALLDRGASVHVMTRSLEKLEELPAAVEGVEGDLTDPATFEGELGGYDGIFLLNAVTPSELQEGLLVVAEAKQAGAEHIVYLSVQNVDRGPLLPHFASKSAIERALKASGVDHTILRPSSFFQNDYWLREALLEYGAYPSPLGDVGVSRVDVRDIGEAAANAFTDEEHRNRTYALVGPDALTGADCARIWSEALGREIAYGGDDLEAWEAQARQMMPAWMTYDFRLMFELFQTEGLAATDAQREQTRSILGGEPRSFEDFVSETAAMWL